MSMENLLARMKEWGLEDTTARGFLEYAKKRGDQELIKGATDLVEMEEEFEKKKAEFLKKNEDLLKKRNQ